MSYLFIFRHLWFIYLAHANEGRVTKTVDFFLDECLFSDNFPAKLESWVVAHKGITSGLVNTKKVK